MKILKSTFLLLVLTTTATFYSCNKDESNSIKGTFDDGIFIVNEGIFGPGGNGSITFFKPDSNLVKQDIFESVNGRPLGNVAQSMTLFNGKAYIVLNNGGAVEVVDIATFKSLATIKKLVNPSQFLAVDNAKAYVSDWVGRIAVIDLKSNVITDTIHAGTGPDAMVKSGNYVYVINSGGFSIDSTVTVIDFTTDKVVKTIKVGDAPSGMVADGTGRIWVMCKGKGFEGWAQPGDTPGKLIRIDPVTLAIDYTYKFTSNDDHPEKLVINKQKSIVYFLHNNGIYSFNIVTSNATPAKLISRYFYGLGYENKTGYLYATDPKSFGTNGVVLRFRSENGSLVDSIPAGIGPRTFAFPE